MDSFSLSLSFLFANSWWVAALFIIMEKSRQGFPLSSPRYHSLPTLPKKWGEFGFGIHEALDQIGAIVGPLIFSFIIFFGGDYRAGFSILWIPALIVIVILVIARNSYLILRNWKLLKNQKRKTVKYFPGYLFSISLFTFLSVAISAFPLISYHLKIKSIMSDVQIPPFLCPGYGSRHIVAILIGKAYDREGLKTLMVIPLLSLFIPFWRFPIVLLP